MMQRLRHSLLSIFIAGCIFSIFLFGFLSLKVETPEKVGQTEKQNILEPQPLIIRECTSIAGTTLNFSIITINTETGNRIYQSVDDYGIKVRIDADNYGQWKCKD